MKKLFWLLSLSIIVVLFVGCSQQAAPAPAPTTSTPPKTTAAPTTSTPPTTTAVAPAKVYNLKLVTYMNDPDIRYKNLKNWAETVKTASKGAINITVYAGGTMAKQADYPDAISRDLVDLAGPFSMSVYPGILPVGTLVEPFTPNDYTKFITDPGVLKILNEEAAQKLNGIYLFPEGMGAMGWFMNKAFTNPEDMKGKLIRSPGGIRDAYVTAWGGKVVNMPSSEVYTAAQRGTMDGATYAIQSFNSSKLYEVLPYVLDNKVWPNSYVPIVMNLDVYKSMSPELQKILIDTGNAMTISSSQEAAAFETKLYSDLSAKGILKISVLDQATTNEWIRRALPAYEPAFQKAGPIGVKMLDYLKANHWMK